MPLLEINQIRYITAPLRYGSMSPPPSRSINTPLSSPCVCRRCRGRSAQLVFSKDRDFQDFLKTPQAKYVPSTLRSRKGLNSGATEEPAKKLVAGWSPRLLRGLGRA
jgi:hypothetical protein